jgi:predicted dinucleotide-binding enzyme
VQQHSIVVRRNTVRIGIVGAGKIGGTLARKLADAENDVGLCNSRGPDSLKDAVAAMGPKVCPMTVQEAAAFGEVVLLALPFGRYKEIPAKSLTGKIVIDATNYFRDRDGHIGELEHGQTTSSELLQQYFRDAKVVKAFNSIRWTVLRDESKPSGAGDRLGIGIAGDDPEAKRVVAELMDQIGYDAVDAGGLAFGGRRLQPDSPLFVARLTAEQIRQRLAA